MLVFALVPFWLKWDFAPAPFEATYVLGFVIVAPMVATVIGWMASGFYGFAALIANRWRILWLFSLGLFAFWATLSQAWAFVAENRGGVAQNAALQIGLVALFVIVVACAQVPRRWMVAIIIGSMLLHGVIGGLQVAQQSDIGLSIFGERFLDPTISGTSVIQSGEWRLLRAYGLLPHPNMLGGILTVGLLACAGWGLIAKRFYWLSPIVFAIGLWLLLLTFSRSAWLGFAVGIVCAIPFVIRAENFWKRFLPLVLTSLIVGGAFVVMYQPLVLARFGLGTAAQEATEIRSVVDRAIYVDIAEIAISERPIVGYGAGNFDWYAAHYLFYYTDYDLRGDNVHNIYLKVWAELGIIGLGLLLIHVVSGAFAVIQQRQVEQIALLAGVIALAVIGMFDHYPITLIQMQTLWLGILALALAPIDDTI